MTADTKNERFLNLIDQHEGILYKIARSYCADPQSREDLVQEMIMQLWRSFERFDARTRFSTWMYRVALNVAISHHRRERRRSGTFAMDEAVLEIASITQTSDPISDDLRMLHQFIGRLDELNRALILLYLEGNDQDSIAEILGISKTNVATKISRIKQRLRREFDET